jgi:hypothetical protein
VARDLSVLADDVSASRRSQPINLTLSKNWGLIQPGSCIHFLIVL